MTFNFDTGERVINVVHCEGTTSLIKGRIIAGPCLSGCERLFGWTSHQTGEIELVGMLFSSDMVIRDDSEDGLETGQAVYDDEKYVYGLVTAGPIWEGEEGTLITAEYDDGLWLELSQSEYLTPTSGCECGNPFTLCHPEA